jgi:hypothetical protein
MKLRKLFILFLVMSLGIYCAFSQVRNELNRLYRSAYEAYQVYDYQTAMDNYKEALELIPGHPVMVYNIGCMHALLGNDEEAIQWLNRAINMGFGYEVGNDEDYTDLRETPEFKTILQKIEEKRKPTENCEKAYSIEEKDLMPEGIAYDPVDKTFYISSVYKCKIKKIDRNGEISDFIQEHQDGLRSVLGMKVDPKRRILWVASTVSSPRLKGFIQDELGWSGIFSFDLKSGQLIKKYILFEEGVRHQFNDLVLTKKGDVYITDSADGSIFWIPKKSDCLELFLHSDNFIFPNGIDLSSNEKKLYVADSQSRILLIDIHSKKIEGITQPDDMTTFGIDGLYYFKKSLIAVQNGLNRISRFYLNKSGNGITSLEIIESNHLLFNIPTTGVIVGNEFYYMANTQLRSFNRDHSIFSMDQLQDIVILKCGMK